MAWTPPVAGPAQAAMGLVGLLGAVLLLVGLLLAWRSRHPRQKRPPKRSFEAGRRQAAMRRVRSADDALAALREGPGEVVLARPWTGGFEIVVRRKRSLTCAQASGFVSGLFESAWAQDVRLDHDACAGEEGGECRYVVTRAGRSGAAGAIPGSGPAPRRSPPARHDGG